MADAVMRRRRGAGEGALGDLVVRIHGDSAKSIAERFGSDMFRPGEIIFYRGHRPVASFLLRHGSVSLEFGSGGRRARGTVVEAPAMLGHGHALGGRAYPVTARAVTPAVVSRIPSAEARSLRWRSPARTEAAGVEPHAPGGAE